MLGADRVSSRVEERTKDGYHPVVRLSRNCVSRARACVVAVKVHCLLFAAACGKEQFPDYVAGLDVVDFLLSSVHLNAKSGFRDRSLVLLRQVEPALLLKTRADAVLSCCVRRRCDGMGLGLVGCWSSELEDAGGHQTPLESSWRRLSCGNVLASVCVCVSCPVLSSKNSKNSLENMFSGTKTRSSGD